MIGTKGGQCRCARKQLVCEGNCLAFGEARDPLLVEREKTHGSFADVATTAQRLKFVIQDTNRKLAKPQQEALDLICTKIARILNGNYMTKDHWLDIAGYAKLGAEACND